jgi:ribosome-associated protein
MHDVFVAPGVILPARDFTWRAVRAAGPGGQNVNKVSTKVELRFDLSGSDALTDAVKVRLRAVAHGRLDADGRIVIQSQLTRSQSQNLEDARQRLAELVRRALKPPRRRRPTKPSAASRERRLTGKHHMSLKKQTRRRVTKAED